MMEDAYDDYTPSETYGEDDLAGGGGEQIPSAQYLNEQIQQIETTKQNAIVLQPTTPPDNPKMDDLWIDNNTFPNIVYRWDGTQWLKVMATTADEVGAYTIAQTDEANQQLSLDLGAIEERTTTIEESVTPDQLVTTVTQHQTYVDDRDAAVKDGIDGLTANMKDEDYLNTNFPEMITTSALTTKANEIVASFKSQGGVNIVKNSVGYGKAADGTLLNWQVVSGAATQVVGNDMIDSGSGISLVTGVIKQAITAIAGQHYTLTAKVEKGTAGSAYMKLSDGTNFSQVDMIVTAAYNYDYIQIAGFVPANNVLIVELSATGATGGAIFTAIMLNTGDVGLQWSNANGELYNTNVQVDINGLMVLSNVYDGYTVMAPSEFSGYYRNGQGVMQKVFTLNKDVTEVAKLKVTDPNATITMGSLQLVNIDGGGKKGWAIVSTT